jgi:transcriptional regulator with XRE-family HTH domain
MKQSSLGTRKLWEFMHQRGLSVRAFAQLAGVSEQAIAKLFRADRVHVPSMATADKIGHHVEISIEEWMCVVDGPPPRPPRDTVKKGRRPRGSQLPAGLVPEWRELLRRLTDSLSHVEIAEKVGVSKQAVGRWLTSVVPRPAHVPKLMKLLRPRSR